MMLELDLNVPKVQKAIIVEDLGLEPRVKIINDYPVPIPKEDEILVRLLYSGVCHSDISVLQKTWGFGPSCKVLGHEGTGYIVKHGSSIKFEEFPLGMKVGVSLLFYPCGKCKACCLDGGEVFCKQNKYYGSDIDGSWQQYAIVHSKYLIKLPDSLENDGLSKSAPILCGGVTSFKALKTSDKPPGSLVAITGAGGGLGSFGIQYAKFLGYRIIAIDSGKEKEELCMGLGAEKFIDFTKQDVKGTILKYTGGIGVDAVMMFAPNEKSYNDSIDYLAIGGALVCVGIPRTDVRLNFSPSALIYTGKKILPSFVGTKEDLKKALDIYSDGNINPQVQVKKMEDIQSIIDDMIDSKIKGRVVIDLD